MLRLMILCTALSFAAGCRVANDAADALARDQAKSVVNSVVESQLPGVNAAPITDCIIDAASASEILSIAGATVTGVTDKTVNQVLEIAQRRDAVRCMAKNGLTMFG